MGSMWIRSNILGLVAIFIALSGSAVAANVASDSGVKAHASKKAKSKVGPRGPQGPAGPSTGPAGGDLTGTFPNPQLGPNSVGSPEIADNAVGTSEIADNGVGSSEVVDESLGTGDLGLDSVGSSELKAARAAVSAGVPAAANTPVTAEVACDAGEAAVGGGYAWTIDDNTADAKMSVSAPSTDPPNPVTGWAARGESSVANTLFAWAICLDV